VKSTNFAKFVYIIKLLRLKNPPQNYFPRKIFSCSLDNLYENIEHSNSFIFHQSKFVNNRFSDPKLWMKLHEGRNQMLISKKNSLKVFMKSHFCISNFLISWLFIIANYLFLLDKSWWLLSNDFVSVIWIFSVVNQASKHWTWVSTCWVFCQEWLVTLSSFWLQQLLPDWLLQGK